MTSRSNMQNSQPFRAEGSGASRHSIRGLLMLISGFFSDFEMAVRVARDYERLRRLSDRTLRDRGLSRERLARQICESHGLLL
jgi:hypothetical protein